MISPATVGLIISLAKALGTAVPQLVNQIKPLLSEGDEKELQKQLDASDAAADAADERAEDALKS